MGRLLIPILWGTRDDVDGDFSLCTTPVLHLLGRESLGFTTYGYLGDGCTQQLKPDMEIRSQC